MLRLIEAMKETDFFTHFIAILMIIINVINIVIGFVSVCMCNINGNETNKKSTVIIFWEMINRKF